MTARGTKSAERGPSESPFKKMICSTCGLDFSLLCKLAVEMHLESCRPCSPCASRSDARDSGDFVDLTSPLVLKLCESIEANCAPIRNNTVGDRADSSEEYSKIVEIESLLVGNGNHLERQLESSNPRWNRDARVQCCIHSHTVPAEVEENIEQRVQIEKAAAQLEESDAEISQIPENQPSEIQRSAWSKLRNCRTPSEILEALSYVG